MTGEIRKALSIAMAIGLLHGTFVTARAEVILQFFNNTWQEIIDKMPEIAEVGYRALWLPPPQKASGDLSVGYDLWDPFDLGGNPQRTGGRTRYGTEEELLRLIETAHRHGIRVYFDNIMNHRAFDIPGYNENTPVDIYPGMLPEDFHLRVTEEGFFRPWGNTVNWGSAWEVQNLYLSGLLDIAQESPNANFGPNLGDTHPKIYFVRHPNNPEYYDYHPTLGWVGFGSPSMTAQVIADNQDFFREDTWMYTMRAIRWLIDRTKADGLRLDAVKHVPPFYFGATGPGADSSDFGYLGQAQWQFNMTRGFSDWDNHRDSVFNTEIPRDDLMMFGEHMGEPPPYGEYFATGMRLLDAKTHSTLNNLAWLPNMGIFETSNYDNDRQFGEALGVYYAKSHDDDVAFNEHLQYANHLTRAGLPNIYTDGNRQAETLGGSGGAFPRHANTKPFGQFGDNRLPNLVWIHNMFSRGSQHGRLGAFDQHVAAYERRDFRDGAANDTDATTMLFMMNRNWDAGQYREIGTSFPEGAWLYQYASGSANFYSQVQDGKIKVTVPPAGYFVFSWRSPEESDLWKFGGGKPITIYSDGKESGWVTYERTDGPDGDAQFNPYGYPNRGFPTNETAKPFTYRHAVPRVTSSSNLSFVARVDGSAENVMFKLNGGVPLNNINHPLGDPRDNPPALSTDVYLGFEQADFVKRIGPEKFAAVDAARNQIGSAGAETYQFTVGQAGFTIHQSSAVNDWNGAHTAIFVYHDPAAMTDDANPLSQFWPPPQNAANSDIWFHAKSGHQGMVNRLYLYYTTDGSWPEGAGGTGIGSTKVIELFFRANVVNGSNTNDWWSENFIPAQPAGTVVKYKIGASREQGYAGAPWDTPFPFSMGDIERKVKMMGQWQIANFNPSTTVYRPHNDYGMYKTGLVEGFNFIQAKAFLQRPGQAQIYNLFAQPFYLDTKPPEGEIKFPIAGQTIYDNRYEFVIRTDPTVTRVWFNIADSKPLNDDGQTGLNRGNGTNALGQTSWVEATRVNPSININSQHPIEWRFTYDNIPSSGQAMISVKLAEISSSTNPLLSDAQGYFTTLSRQITTMGPDLTMNVAWPQQNGDTIGAGYVMKVHFSEAMWGNTPEETVRNRFLISVNGLAQPRTNYVLNWMGGGNGLHELAFELPDLWNGDPNYQHIIEVVHTNAAGGGVTLFADRRVRAIKSSDVPTLTIIDPPLLNLDGAPYQIVLPDVANPSPTQRQHNIMVQTPPEVQSVWITFTNSSGTANPVASSTSVLAGTVSVINGSKNVTGAGTTFDSQLAANALIEIGTNRVRVSQVVSSNLLLLVNDYPGATASGQTVRRIQGNPTFVGNSLFWQFTWSNLEAGVYTLIANASTDGNTNTIEAQASRTTRVILRQRVQADPNDPDDDDDGVSDVLESAPVNLPDTNPESWNNGQVHLWVLAGRTDPLSPDTDGDGLSDGLELGWGAALSGTSTNTDTNGDGWPNFMPDQDPPIFNTFDNQWHPKFDRNRGRTDQIGGSMTDPNRADTDNDGLDDNVEDMNRNGRVDIGLLNGSGVVTGIMVHPNIPTVYNTSRVARDELPVNARFLETDPNNPDTDGDGISDGFEDANRNGRVDLALLWPAGTTPPFVVTFTNNSQYLLAGNLAGIRSRALDYTKLFTDFPRPTRAQNGTWSNTNAWPRLLFQETDPLVGDTNGDGLPDGWKVRFGLDPFDNGWYNLRTGHISPTNTQQGADGDITGDGVNNITHFLSGSDPRVDINIPVPVGSITIGPGPVIGQLGGQDIREEFMDWRWSDLRALDFYDGDGPNDKQGDIFPAGDGFDTSRDLMAFYSRDGGALNNGGDGRMYFRIDMYDLQPFAEEGNLDLYVVIDTGNPAIGERVLPDEVDALTDMRWEVVVAVYDSASGMVYVDMNPNQNTSVLGESLASVGGVASKGNYFLGAYFNSELDAVEFAIDRQALLDTGWNQDPASLNFQVYSTRDGTCNSCNSGGPGLGDIGGRNDIRDSIKNDYISEHYWERQAGLAGQNSVLREWIRGDSRPNRSKLAKIVHGNQAIQPGSSTMGLINNNAGAGYYRVIDTHEVLGIPLNLHVTPTLASSIQWASVDPAAGMPWLDGPSFNQRIGDLIRTNLIALMASTFSDNILPYFTTEYILDNERLAREFLQTIYGVTITTNAVFWTPERVLDRDVFEKIGALGYRATVLDQMEHLFKWFGRTAALGTRGYQMNRIDGINTFAINNGANDFRFANHDQGLSMPLRRLFNRQSRGNWDQVTTLMSNWEDFTSKNLADAYDRNMRWIANRPWIKVVTLEDILNNRVDLNGDGQGDTWYVEERGSLAGAGKSSHNFVNYASRSNYDNWYLGSSTSEGLLNKVFESRPGVNLPASYGMLFSGGIISQAWDRVKLVTNTNLGKLARGVIHASVFQTAFHDQTSVDLRKFSNGEYITPNTYSNRLAGFAKIAQSQTRMAAIYSRVNSWLASAGTMTTTAVETLDVDLDGQLEYLMYNRNIFAIFERMGGRLVAAWTRDPASGQAFQVIGNLHSYSGFDNEWEGEFNVFTNGVVRSFRTSALKDWWAGTTEYVNDLYTFTNWTNGWRITSSDGRIVKTVTLGGMTNWINVAYTVSPTLNGGTLFVRNGLNPDLQGLLLHGQKYLGNEQHADGVMTLSQAQPQRTVSAMIAYGGGFNTTFNTNAVDDNPGQGVDFKTRRMRNQAQTHQVELSGAANFSFAIGFATSSGVADTDGDGIPDDWELLHFGSPTGANPNALASNQVNTVREAYIANLNPNDPNDFFEFDQSLRSVAGITVRFATKSEREYLIWYTDNSLMTPTWFLGSTNRIQGTGSIYDWLDDGTTTTPHPFQATNRVYKIEVQLPQ